MRKGWRTAIIVLVAVILVGTISGLVIAKTLLDKPLGPVLNAGQENVQPSISDATPAVAQIQNPVQEQQPVQEQKPVLGSNLPVVTPLRPLCGKVPALSILAVGIDFRGDNYLYGLADVIRVVRVDFTTHTVSVLTLDRAIWVEIPGIADHYGITHGLLNQSYFYGVPATGYYDGPGGGAGLLAATLKKNFNLDVDNYVVVDFHAFVKFVDALGGIDIDLPEPVDGTPSFPFFNAGRQHLDGSQALQLARIREKYSTLIRNRNQNLILKAIYQKIASPAILHSIPELVQVFKNAGLTDLSPRQIESMLCLLRKMDKSDLVFREIPDKYYKYDWIYSEIMHQDVNIWTVDFDVFRSYISEFMEGGWPQP